MTQNIVRATQSGTGTGTGKIITKLVILFWFLKTFDTVDSEILTKKIQWFGGIKDMPLSWFENNLTDRKQTVQFKTVQSEERPVNCDVPQGSILRLLLFILYVNDLPKVCSKTKPPRLIYGGVITLPLHNILASRSGYF